MGNQLGTHSLVPLNPMSHGVDLEQIEGDAFGAQTGHFLMPKRDTFFSPNGELRSGLILCFFEDFKNF